jgi:hypothetical protein
MFNLLVFERFHMGIAFFSFLSSLFDNLSRWLNPPRATYRPSGSVLRAQSRITPKQWAINTVNGKSAGLRLNTPMPQATPLRVVHLREADITSACAGRMRISGRMADVCAELDRLIAQEAQNLAH